MEKSLQTCQLSKIDPNVSSGQLRTGSTDRMGIRVMPDVTVVYWRDIPAQVIVGRGRKGTKKPLHERFEQAIDRAAMKDDAKDTDSYLAAWRKGDPYTVEGDAADIVASEVSRLEAEYDKDRILVLVNNNGWD
jgi:cvfA/B/C family virulence factor